MDMNQELQNKLKNLDTSTLKNATEKASKILGKDARQVSAMLGSPEKLQQALGKLTRDDYALIQTALSNPEKLNDIIKSKQGQNKK